MYKVCVYVGFSVWARDDQTVEQKSAKEILSHSRGDEATGLSKPSSYRLRTSRQSLGGGLNLTFVAYALQNDPKGVEIGFFAGFLMEKKKENGSQDFGRTRGNCQSQRGCGEKNYCVRLECGTAAVMAGSGRSRTYMVSTGYTGYGYG